MLAPKGRKVLRLNLMISFFILCTGTAWKGGS